MPSVREIAEEIVAREGGFVNDPDDPGGATNHGVTIHTMRRLGIDLTGDGKTTEADVRRLTRAQAVDIYIEHYHQRPGIGALPEALQPSVFDMYVNAGANAVKVLQRLLTEMGFPCDADGGIGPQTIRAAQSAAEAAPGHIADAYAIARRNYYYGLADARPASRKYARRKDGGKGGWITRAEAFMAGKYHLSDRQHRERTASWA
jgi:lysozyme family protein